MNRILLFSWFLICGCASGTLIGEDTADVGAATTGADKSSGPAATTGAGAGSVGAGGSVSAAASGASGAASNGSGDGFASSGAGTAGGGTGTTGGTIGTTGGTGSNTSGVSGTALGGTLAFTPQFSGEFYELLPDGGADLSNLDCRIADGLDLVSECSGWSGDDAGLSLSRHLLDIYVTSANGKALTTGSAPVQTDGGGQVPLAAVATIELTVLTDGGREFLQANSGNVYFQATAAGMSGTFAAQFMLTNGSPGTLTGSFNANYCSSLDGY